MGPGVIGLAPRPRMVSARIDWFLIFAFCGCFLPHSRTSIEIGLPTSGSHEIHLLLLGDMESMDEPSCV